MIWMLEAALPRIAENAALADAVAAHDHVGGAEHVDGVAVLAGAAGVRAGVLDAVVGDQAAVVGACSLCQTRMPPLPEPRMVLAVIERPRLSMQNSALSAAPVMRVAA